MDASGVTFLEHDPEKWKPVFRKDHAPPKKSGAQSISLKTIARGGEG